MSRDRKITTNELQIKIAHEDLFDENWTRACTQAAANNIAIFTSCKPSTGNFADSHINMAASSVRNSFVFHLFVVAVYIYFVAWECGVLTF